MSEGGRRTGRLIRFTHSQFTMATVQRETHSHSSESVTPAACHITQSVTQLNSTQGTARWWYVIITSLIYSIIFII